MDSCIEVPIRVIIKSKYEPLDYTQELKDCFNLKGLKESLCAYLEETTQLELFGNKKLLQVMTN